MKKNTKKNTKKNCNVECGKKLTCLTKQAEKVVIDAIDKMMVKLSKMKNVEYIDLGDDDGNDEIIIGELNDDTAFREVFLDEVNDLVYEKLIKYT